VAVLVQQEHACLEADGNLLAGPAPVVRVEDCFAADALVVAVSFDGCFDREWGGRESRAVQTHQPSAEEVR
jgi:hypothetical protein